ncbi:MAG: choice-of-anchor Q domain-containing protein [Chthoniobacterales bacterium]
MNSADATITRNRSGQAADATSSGATISPAQATDHIGVTPAQLNLASLQDNSGNTQTHALLSGSIAIDQGDPAAGTTDQRGFTRIGVSDSGAFEFNGTPPALQVVGAVSRKNHAGADFDLNLPLVGTPAVESRTGGASGSHAVIFTFANPITNVGSVPSRVAPEWSVRMVWAAMDTSMLLTSPVLQTRRTSQLL